MNPYNNLPITKYEKVRPRLHFFDYNIHMFYIYVYLDPFKEKYSKYKLPNGEVIEFMYEPVYVGKGTNVKKGQQIGVLGLSSDREPVLYFETRISSKAVDPRTFLN